MGPKRVLRHHLANRPDGLSGFVFTLLGDPDEDRNRIAIHGHDRLFEKLRPYRHRFIFAASCNTAIDARWETLLDFRDAWRELA